MARHGFWNSKKQSNGIGDRLYNAEDLSFFYDLFFNSGIACSMNELETEDMFLVTLTSGSYSVKINQGTAIINGKWYNGIGDSAAYLTMNTTHTVSSGLARIDAVCIKKDDENRKFIFYIKEGVEATNPVPPTIDKDVELGLAYYTVSSSYTVNYDSLVDTRMDSNFAGCASLKMRELTTTLDEHLNKVFYFCNGINDNVKLSRLVSDYYVNEKNKDLEIMVVGDLGVSGFAGGQGTADDPLQIFCLGKYNNTETNEDSTANKNNVKVNFKNCNSMTITRTHVGSGVAGYAVVLFAGNENNIENARFVLDVEASANRIFFGHDNKAKDCYFKADTSTAGAQSIAVEGSGRFENCDIITVASIGESIGFVPNNNIGEATTKVLDVIGCRILSQNKAGVSSEANGLYVRANDTTAILRASRNTIYGATDSTVKITKPYKINSGKFIITDNIVQAEGAVYSTTEGVNANNIVIDNLADLDINYYN